MMKKQEKELTTLQIVFGIISSIGFTLLALYLVIIGFDYTYIKSNEIISLLDVTFGIYILISVWGLYQVPFISEVLAFFYWLKPKMYWLKPKMSFKVQ